MECRICGSKDLSLFYMQGSQEQYKFYKCANCKLVNLDLSNVEITENQAKYVERFIKPIDYEKQKGALEAYQFVSKYVPGKGKFLDIGCGNGNVLYYFKKNGWKVKGLELSPVIAKYVEQNLNIKVDVVNFLEVKEFPEKYDLISLRHVLEHLPNSILAMNKISGLLKKSGYAHFEFPNINSLTHEIQRIKNKVGLNKKYDPSYVPAHCNEFSKHSFEYLIKKTGFKIIRWETYSSKIITNLIYKLFHIGSKARVIVQKIN